MKKTLNCRGRLVDLSRPVVMGILNLTPDSFYADSRATTDQAVQRAGQMLLDGATFIDLGGYSTRPGAPDIGPAEEADRLLPALEALHRAFPQALLSVDTFRASVARQAAQVGAVIINDISGGNLDPDMFQTVADLNLPYVLTHGRGTPQTMQSLTHYADLVPDVLDEIGTKRATLRALGVTDVILDPGFGFAKTVAQNFTLLRELPALRVFDEPLLVGLSRKSTIWRTLGTTADRALNGTTVLNTVALLGGAAILRVHDVREAIEAITLMEATGIMKAVFTS
jgi:dihydropteroate synthase